MEIHCFRIEDSKGNLKRIGAVYGDIDCLDQSVADRIWDLCNWSCWHNDRNPKKVSKDGLEYTRTEHDRGVMNSDLVLVTEGKVMVSLPVGWETFTNVQDAVEFRLNYEMPLFY